MSRHDVLEHGALGDGSSLDTAAIQHAIDAAHADGGGTVIVPSGRTYLTGSIELRSHVELHIERGAVLQGSSNWPDYTARFAVGALSAGVVTEGTETTAALLTARDATDIAISAVASSTVPARGSYWARSATSCGCRTREPSWCS